MDLDLIKNKTYLIFTDVLRFHVQINELISFVTHSGIDLKFYANAQTYRPFLIIHHPQTFFPSTEENNIYHFALRRPSALRSCGYIPKTFLRNMRKTLESGLLR